MRIRAEGLDINFVVYRIYPSGNFNRNLKQEVQAMDKNLGVTTRRIMKFKSLRLDEFSKEEHVDLLVGPNSTFQSYNLEESLTQVYLHGVAEFKVKNMG